MTTQITGIEVTFNPPITVKDELRRKFFVKDAKAAPAPLTLTSVHATWIDDGTSVKVIMTECPESKFRPITLWDATTTPAYSTLGDWTEAQAEAALKTLISK